MADILDNTLYPMVASGRTFCASTGAAGVSIPVYTSTSPKVVLYNPQGSGYDLVLLKTTVGHVSTTNEPGHWVYGISTNLQATAPSSTTAGDIVNLLVGDGAAAVGDFYKAATVGASYFTYATPIGFSQVAQADTSTNAPYELIDYVNGLIVIQPGGALCVAADAVSSAFVTASVGMVWYERKRIN